MKGKIALVGAAGLGISLMYLIDVVQGKRRLPETPTVRVIQGVSRVIPGRVGRRWRERELTATVQAEISRVLGRPHAVAAEVVGGRVTLRGGVQNGEAAALVDRIEKLPGVVGVDNQLVLLDLMEDLAS